MHTLQLNEYRFFLSYDGNTVWVETCYSVSGVSSYLKEMSTLLIQICDMFLAELRNCRARRVRSGFKSAVSRHKIGNKLIYASSWNRTWISVLQFHPLRAAAPKQTFPPQTGWKHQCSASKTSRSGVNIYGQRWKRKQTGIKRLEKSQELQFGWLNIGHLLSYAKRCSHVEILPIHLFSSHKLDLLRTKYFYHLHGEQWYYVLQCNETSL